MFNFRISVPLTHFFSRYFQHSYLLENNLFSSFSNQLHSNPFSTDRSNVRVLLVYEVSNSFLVVEDWDSFKLLLVELNQNFFDFVLEQFFIKPVNLFEIFGRKIRWFQYQRQKCKSVTLEVINVANIEKLKFHDTLAKSLFLTR